MSLVSKDQLGRSLLLPKHPERIISLVPSITEFICDLGLQKQLVGRTRFCIHPATILKEVKKVGGTKKLKPELIHQLKPDLIIANKEENIKSQIDELAALYPVWISDVNSYNEALEMMKEIGILCGKPEEANAIIHACIKKQSAFNQSIEPEITFIYLIWKEPWMVAGHHTFISSFLSEVGFKNILPASFTRYPEISVKQIKELNPRCVFLSTEPYPFTEKHISELSKVLSPIEVCIINGEYASWYGSRMVNAIDYLRQLHHSCCTNKNNYDN
jgi:ABC-type Fe3+-hydroxamate transport system substrate-binding protein